MCTNERKYACLSNHIKMFLALLSTDSSGSFQPTQLNLYLCDAELNNKSTINTMTTVLQTKEVESITPSSVYVMQ